MSFIKRIAKRLLRLIRKEKTDPVKNENCTEFEVDNWVISAFIVNKLVPIVGTHPYPVAELNLMVAAVCRLRPQQIFEWGTNIGKSARIFFETGRQFNLPIEIHSMDLPDDQAHIEHPGAGRGYMVRNCAGVTLYQADGLEKSIELYKTAPEKRTLVFIDGDHSYESVRRELNGVIDAMPNANILLHDTFYQSETSGYNVGPNKTVAEALTSHPGKYRIMSTTTGLPGMTLLYKL